MKNLFKLGGIGVILIILLTTSCCKKITNPFEDDKKVDTTLVTFENQNQLDFQIKVLQQFDSLNSIIKKQDKLIDSLVDVKSNIQYLDKIIYKEKLSSKYNDKQIDSIIQSNKNLRNIIKHQNIMKK